MALGISLKDSARGAGRSPPCQGPGGGGSQPPARTIPILIDYAHSPGRTGERAHQRQGLCQGTHHCALWLRRRPGQDQAPQDGQDRRGHRRTSWWCTSDNPRTENPGDIIADILPGLEGSDTPHVVIEDRVEAIHWAMDHAQPGDVIALCGKGHETYQEINHVKHHMDEREIVADYLKAGN